MVRPRKDDSKRGVLTLRVMEDTRARLVEAADENGRSLAREVEHRLQNSLMERPSDEPNPARAFLDLAGVIAAFENFENEVQSTEFLVQELKEYGVWPDAPTLRQRDQAHFMTRVAILIQQLAYQQIRIDHAARELAIVMSRRDREGGPRVTSEAGDGPEIQ